MTRPLCSLIFFALLSHDARADCPSVDTWTERVEQDIVSLRLDEAQEARAQAEAGFACGAPATTAQIARFWRAEGVLFTVLKQPDDAAIAFEAARRVAPTAWTPVFGTELEKVFRATPAPTGSPSALKLQPWDTSYRAWLDGAPATLPATVSPGLHLVQASRTGEDVETGKIFEASGGDALTVSLPFPAAPAPLPQTATVAAGPSNHRRAALLFAGGGAAALAGGALLWTAERQNADYPATTQAYANGKLTLQEAQDQVDGVHGRQIGLGAGGGALIAAGAGLVVVGVVTW